VAKEHDLSFATRMRSEQSDEPSTEQFAEIDHADKATALLRPARMRFLVDTRHFSRLSRNSISFRGVQVLAEQPDRLGVRHPIVQREAGERMNDSRSRIWYAV
jgi:hypothetical protein